MDLERKRIFTNVLRGDQVRRDVMRTAINFGDHFIPFVNSTEKALREDLEERVFMGLTEIALESMTSSREKKSELQEQRALLRTKLRSLQSSNLGLESFAKPQTGTKKLSEIQAKLSDIEAKLAKLSVRTSALEDNLAHLQAVLRNPQDHISIEPRSLKITRMGLEPDPKSSQDKVDEISYMEVSYRDVTVVGTLTRYARTDLLPERRIEDIRVL
jgi:chromosome segregation ATPase